MSAPIPKDLQTTWNKFRVLKDWTFNYDEDSQYKGQVTVNESEKLARFYGWEAESPIPSDFWFHEVLHISLRAVIALKGTRRYEAEESTVQDICKFVRDCIDTKRIAELEHQLASSEDIRHAEKRILIAEIKAHKETKRQLAEAQEKLDKITIWCEAYPLDVFIPPDWKKVQALLGETLLGQVSAACMRHVTDGVAKIVRE